jgi:hypothetical protein
MKNLPFKETDLGGNRYQRLFEHSTPCDDLLWHFDLEDRIVECHERTNWKIQFDNELPKEITETLFIPKMVFHRLIKGDGDLNLIINKL